LTFIIVVPMVMSLRILSCLILSLPVCLCVAALFLRYEESHLLGYQDWLFLVFNLDCVLVC